MHIEPVDDDSALWKIKGLVNPEVTALAHRLLELEPGKTYNVHLDNPMKRLKPFLYKTHAGVLRLNIKAKDESFQNWYIRIDPRPAIKRLPRKASPKKKDSKTTVSSASGEGNANAVLGPPVTSAT